jgi:hypothetical protein
MLSKLRPRSVYDVLAAIAFFAVVAGGSAYAAATIGSRDIKRNAVLSRHIKNGEVKNVDLGSNSVGGGNVIDDALTGKDIVESTLGIVPNAAQLGGQPASTYRLRCPTGLEPTADLCFEPGLRGPTDWNTAVETCRRAQRHLPSLTELAAVYNAIDAGQNNEWTSDTAPPSGGSGGGAVMILAQSNARVLTRTWEADSSSVLYRCVTSPTN